jgi:hypothetical protein
MNATLELLTPTLIVPQISKGRDDPVIPAQLRQGDVLLISVPTIPKEASLPSEKRASIFLMPAKENGHPSHCIDSENVLAFTMGDSSEITYLSVGSPFVFLTHHEHASMAIPMGNWKVMRQREHVACAFDSVPIIRAVAD